MSIVHAVDLGQEYETVAAGPTAQVLGTTGAKGDYLKGLLIVPASVSPGAVTIIDHETSIVVFAGGSNSLTELKPNGCRSASAACRGCGRSPPAPTSA